MEKQKTAIILQGGALRAAFAAGAARALLRRGVMPDYVAGTSASSLTSAYLAARQGDTIEEVWTKKIGDSNFISLRNIFLGKPVFNIGYLIDKVLRLDYPLDLDALALSHTEWIIPLYDYKAEKVALLGSKTEGFRQTVWDLMKVSCIVHSDDILRGTRFEWYVDGALDPYALFRTPWLPESSRVFVIWSEVNSGWHPMKKLGTALFNFFQARGFPDEIKSLLKRRKEFIETGIVAYEEFKKRHEVVVIAPQSSAWYESVRVIDPSQRRITALFREGEHAVPAIEVGQALPRREAVVQYKPAAPDSRCVPSGA